MSECPNCHMVTNYIGDMKTAVQSLSRAEAEIDRLHVELADAVSSARATQVCADRDWNRALQAEARLAAVIALCDYEHEEMAPEVLWALIDDIRAAATGDTR